MPFGCLLRVINKNNNFLKGIFQMASNDGFIPYPIGLSANQSVIGIRNGYALPETLKEYSHVSDQLDPPNGDTVYNQHSFWYNETNSKLYRALKNESAQITVWFEVWFQRFQSLSQMV